MSPHVSDQRESRRSRPANWAGDRPPWDRLAALQLPESRRSHDDHAEPAAVDIPAISVDVDSGAHRGTVTAVFGMHDADEGGQLWSCSREPSRGNQDLGRVRTLTSTAWAQAALDDHRDGQTVLRRAG